MVLSPAYGRDYKSKAGIAADFNSNKDFLIESIGPDMGRYVNKAQLLEAGISEVEIRYAKLSKAAILEVK